MLQMLSKVFGRKNNDKAKQASRLRNRRLGLEKLEDRWCPAATYEWSGALSSAWELAGNWTKVGGGSGVPGYTDTAKLNSNGYAPSIPTTVLVGGVPTPYHPVVDTLELQSSFSGRTLTISTSGDLTVLGSVTHTLGTISLQPCAALYLNGADYDFNGGAIVGGGGSVDSEYVLVYGGATFLKGNAASTTVTVTLAIGYSDQSTPAASGGTLSMCAGTLNLDDTGHIKVSEYGNLDFGGPRSSSGGTIASNDPDNLTVDIYGTVTRTVVTAGYSSPESPCPVIEPQLRVHSGGLVEVFNQAGIRLGPHDMIEASIFTGGTLHVHDLAIFGRTDEITKFTSGTVVTSTGTLSGLISFDASTLWVGTGSTVSGDLGFSNGSYLRFLGATDTLSVSGDFGFTNSTLYARVDAAGGGNSVTGNVINVSGNTSVSGSTLNLTINGTINVGVHHNLIVSGTATGMTSTGFTTINKSGSGTDYGYFVVDPSDDWRITW